MPVHHLTIPHTPEPSPAPRRGGAPGHATADRFSTLFVAYAPYVRRVMPRMGVASADLDDAVQEVFLAVHRGLPTFEGRSREKTWIYGICIRVCSNYRRRAHRRHEQLTATPPEGDDTQTPERALAAKAALAQLDLALAELPDVQRAAFVLHEIELLSVNEIAEVLGCSKFTVYARLKTARHRVTAQMRPFGGSFPAPACEGREGREGHEGHEDKEASHA